MAEIPKTRIFQVDDDPDYLKSMGDLFQVYDLDIVLTAGTVAQALSYIPTELIKRKVNLALIDGNLPDGTGDLIAAAIRKSRLPIGIIALSANKQGFGDVNINKAGGPMPVIAAIENLTRT